MTPKVLENKKLRIKIAKISKDWHYEMTINADKREMALTSGFAGRLEISIPQVDIAVARTSFDQFVAAVHSEVMNVYEIRLSD
ncbi:hypothetical protein SAMN05192560_0002 [Methylobacillus rhizosphaerae]|uniref:Uncharacterized protein n=2 Tax=Methylobacillus rhizosphaerae TaxID=551994 RepID=A0A238XLL2_9PROT|nr:hypothetical protein SAMN05192560_0002 [Methylobacillus rhizosphaerae]